MNGYSGGNVYGEQPKLNPLVKLILLGFDGLDFLRRLMDDLRFSMVLVTLIALYALVRDIWLLAHHVSYGGVPFVVTGACLAMAAIFWRCHRYSVTRP